MCSVPENRSVQLGAGNDSCVEIVSAATETARPPSCAGRGTSVTDPTYPQPASCSVGVVWSVGSLEFERGARVSPEGFGVRGLGFGVWG